MNDTSPASFTPPWQAMQFLFRIGRTSLLKSTAATKGEARSGSWMKNLSISCGD